MDSRNRGLSGNLTVEKAVSSGAIPAEEKVLAGKIVPAASDLKGEISTSDRGLSGRLDHDSEPLQGNIPGTLEFHYSDAAPEYAGSYEVIPALDSQTMETAGQLMRKDVTIKPIPIYEVSNNAGGTTVIIGG